MGKLKSKKIAGKRFRLTKNGKLMHRTQGSRHLRRRKNKSRQRKQDRQTSLKNIKEQKKVKSMLA